KPGFGDEVSRKLPAFAILRPDEFGRFGSVRRFEAGGVPIDWLSEPVRNDSEQHCLGQRPRIVEVTGRRFARLAGANPLRMVADRVWDRLLGWCPPGELLLGVKLHPSVVGEH